MSRAGERDPLGFFGSRLDAWGGGMGERTERDVFEGLDWIATDPARAFVLDLLDRLLAETDFEDDEDAEDLSDRLSAAIDLVWSLEDAADDLGPLSEGAADLLRDLLWLTGSEADDAVCGPAALERVETLAGRLKHLLRDGGGTA